MRSFCLRIAIVFGADAERTIIGGIIAGGRQLDLFPSHARSAQIRVAGAAGELVRWIAPMDYAFAG